MAIIKFIKKLLRKKNVTAKPINARYIIDRSQHQVSKADISQNAMKVLNHLNHAGYQAYLVGGSVRDLLLSKAPKDFDVATDATPAQIKKLFRNARIIGRRFKLVHIFFNRDREIIEVATFRSSHQAHDDHHVNEQGMLVRDNVYGSLEDDAWRRDFTLNSLYYHIEDSSIIDFTGGVQDIHHKQIRIIGNPVTRYEEDPVRMLRAIRFSAKLNFDIEPKTAEPIHQLNHLICNISNARLFDEMTKIYHCGEAQRAQSLMVHFGLFDKLFPAIYQLFNHVDYPVKAFITLATESTDNRIQSGKTANPAFLFAVLLWFPLRERSLALQEELQLPPLGALEKAMSDVLAKQWKTIAIPKRYSQMIREIWLLQYRFPKRSGTRAYHILTHPRFRAAYDFLVLRAQVGDETQELAHWWTLFQEVSEAEQAQMIADISAPKTSAKKRKRRFATKKSKENPSSASMASSDEAE